MTDTANEPYAPHDGWFGQMQRENGEWITYSPTHDRTKALDRVKINRIEHPELTHRLIKETTHYAIDNEEQ